MRKKYLTEREMLLQNYGSKGSLWTLLGWGYIVVLTVILVAIV